MNLLQWEKSNPAEGTSKQFKTDAVELALRSNKTVLEIAEELGILPELLYRWKNEYQGQQQSSFPGSGYLKDIEAERLRKLEREL